VLEFFLGDNSIRKPCFSYITWDFEIDELFKISSGSADGLGGITKGEVECAGIPVGIIGAADNIDSAGLIGVVDAGRELSKSPKRSADLPGCIVSSTLRLFSPSLA
jgi:hypothetical protein